MSREALSGCVALLTLTGLAVASSSNAKKPNFVLLMPDQWRFDWDSRHMDGDNEIPLRLPVLNSLQEKGTRFTQVFDCPQYSCLVVY